LWLGPAGRGRPTSATTTAGRSTRSWPMFMPRSPAALACANRCSPTLATAPGVQRPSGRAPVWLAASEFWAASCRALAAGHRTTLKLFGPPIAALTYGADRAPVATGLVNLVVPAAPTELPNAHGGVVIGLIARAHALGRGLRRRGNQPSRLSRNRRRAMPLHPGRAGEARGTPADEVIEQILLAGREFSHSVLAAV
jgi:hypothetical protein